MNTGMDDSANLAWKLAAVLQGWGGPNLLDSYQGERKPTGIRNTGASRKYASMMHDAEVPENIEAEGPEGDAARIVASHMTYVRKNHFLPSSACRSAAAMMDRRSLSAMSRHRPIISRPPTTNIRRAAYRVGGRRTSASPRMRTYCVVLTGRALAGRTGSSIALMRDASLAGRSPPSIQIYEDTRRSHRALRLAFCR